MSGFRRLAAVLCIVAALFAIVPGSAKADTFDVLWYTGGAEPFSGFATYAAAVANLVTQVPAGPGANNWNVTLWTGGPQPAGSFDSLVVASPQGGWTTFPTYGSLTGAAPTLGDRIMVTGQDADWHYMHGPGPTPFDGPQGFLINAINWASSGTGMGAVLLGLEGPELLALLGAADFAALGTESSFGTNNVVIPASKAGYPINTNLSSAGLSNWNTSAHRTWTGTNATVWEGINIDGNVAGGDSFVTLVSAATGGGSIPGVPEPATITMLATGVVGLFGSAWRRRKVTA